MGTRTHHSSVPEHLVIVPTAIPTAKVQRLMHISQKVNEELERLRRRVGSTRGRRRRRAAGKVGQDGTDVPYGVEGVDALATHPAVRAGELAVVGRVVADAFGKVQWGGPGSAVFIGPGGDRRKVARRVAAAATIAVGTEDGADGAQDLWVEVRLGEGGDDFVAFCMTVREADTETGCRQNVPSGPQAITLGRLLRPTTAAAMNVRMAGIWYRKRNGSRTMRFILYASGLWPSKTTS